MKRRIALILVVTIVTTLLWACDKKPTEQVAEQPEEKQEEEQVVQEEEKTENFVNEGDIPEYAYTSVEYDNDYEYFTGKIHCVELTDSKHPQLAEAVNDYFSDAVKDFNKTCEAMLKEAKEENQERAKTQKENEDAEDEFVYDYTAYYDYELYVEVTRCDNQMFSIKLDEYSYTGGAHGITNIYGVTFDSATGEILENTSFEASVPAIAAAIREDINNSTAEAKEALDPDYDDYISRMESGLLSTVGVWFNERGIVIGFPEYTIGPYAIGVPTFNIPYSKLTGFDEKYIPKSDFYTATVSTAGFADSIDVDGDGKEETVYLESSVDEDYMNTFTLHVGREMILLGEGNTYWCEPMFIHSSTGNYLVAECAGDNDWHELIMYDISKGYAEIQTMSGSIKDITDGRATISYSVDAFGTWSAKKDYTYDGNGFSSAQNVDILDNNPINNADARGIKLKKSLKYTDSNGESAKLDKGTVIYPISHEKNKLEFMNIDGTIKGSFEYEYKEGIRYVDGEDEYDLFVELPYAG